MDIHNVALLGATSPERDLGPLVFDGTDEVWEGPDPCNLTRYCGTWREYQQRIRLARRGRKLRMGYDPGRSYNTARSVSGSERKLYRPTLPTDLDKFPGSQAGGQLHIDTLESRRNWLREVIDPLCKGEDAEAQEKAVSEAAEESRRSYENRRREGTQ
jgi:hypothetical protein